LFQLPTYVQASECKDLPQCGLVQVAQLCVGFEAKFMGACLGGLLDMCCRVPDCWGMSLLVTPCLLESSQQVNGAGDRMSSLELSIPSSPPPPPLIYCILAWPKFGTATHLPKFLHRTACPYRQAMLLWLALRGSPCYCMWYRFVHLCHWHLSWSWWLSAC